MSDETLRTYSERVAWLQNQGTRNPTQWCGQMDDGREIYVRYRHGWLSVYISLEPDGDVLGDDEEALVFEKQLARLQPEEPYREEHGLLSYEDLRRHARGIEWPSEEG